MTSGGRLKELAKKRVRLGTTSGSSNVGPSSDSGEGGRPTKRVVTNPLPPPSGVETGSLSLSGLISKDGGGKSKDVVVHERDATTSQDSPVSFPILQVDCDWRGALALDKSENAEGSKSPWNKNFEVDQVIDAYMTDPHDMDKVKTLGLVGMCRTIEHYSACSATLARLMDREY